MDDGVGLRESWYAALDTAQTNFRQLLTSHSSPDWKRVNDSATSSGSSPKGKARASTLPQLTDVIVHRRVVKGETVYRAVLDVPVGEDGTVSLDACKSVLLSPELRKEWDPAVEGAQLLEMCDQVTRVVKTNFTLGWPASPRDAVTISRTFNDATTLIDISTSLPRSPNEPTYLRPSPPYVRSEVTLFAWCIQVLKPQSPSADSSKSPLPTRLRLTNFWQHDLKAPWNFGSTSNMASSLNAMMVGFFKSVQTRGTRIPLLLGYGNGVSVERIRFENDRDALSVDYSIVPEDEDHHVHHKVEQGVEELHAIREHRRLARSIECALPAGEGWDVQLSTKGSSEEVSQLPWTIHATRDTSIPETLDDKIIFRVKHAPLPNDHSVLKVSIVIERSSPTGGIRLNGIPQPIEKIEERDPSSYFMSEQMLQDASSTADFSLKSRSTFASTSTSTTLQDVPQLTRTLTGERSAAAEKALLSRVKRNYIYFSSLLQEPEAKWKRTTEARGVSIAQLDSIDPTLVVYRAEATFVGLGLWDLYATIVSPGARAQWDKLHDDAVLLEDVNQLTELWHYKTKPAWPVVGRDAVVLKTVYKSSSTIHVFAFSADDPNLFPQMPPTDPNVIRTQVDLQGWAIEALSPTTTLLTLLEQSDPKGWKDKTSIPQQMITTVTGVGEFAIKFGGPPIVTRLDGARSNDMRYDHERGSFRIEYENAPDRRSSDAAGQASPAAPSIECELRCDLDAWATSLDIVVDPPPLSVACLRRHRLSAAGGGLWLTISHDAVHASDERLQVIVRRAPQGGTKEKGLVMVNGAKVEVDVEELPDKEVKTLAKKKRIKPVRIPLDQPPVEGAIRRRRAEWDAEQNSKVETPISPTTPEFTTSAPKFVSTWTKYFNYAVEQATTTTQQYVAAISPATGLDVVPSASKTSMQYALDALSYIQGLHASTSTDDWTLLSEKDFPVYRKVAEQISPVIPVHKGEKVIEGVSAEELASVISSYDCRKQWDTRFDSANILESFGAGSHTAFVVTKGGFPFRDRGFYLANIVARQTAPSSSLRRHGDSEQQSDSGAAIFCVSASFAPQSVSTFSQAKYNPYTLPVGRVFIDGWILETLDPYTSENYAIPSARCSRIVAVDYGGSVPAAVNSMINGLLPKSILAVETYVKSKSPPPFMRQPAANLVISNKHDDDPLSQQWSLRRRDPTRTSVTTSFQPANRTYHSVSLINTAGQILSVPSSSPLVNDRTPRPSRIMQSPRTPSPTSADAPPGSRGGERSTTSTTPIPTPSSSRIIRNDNVVRSRSRDAPIKSSPSMFTNRGEVRHPVDLLLSELVVDSKLYPEGYEVITESYIDKTKAALPLPGPSITKEDKGNALPIAFTIYTLPPSPHHSSGLNIDRPPRHLLRLTLPTAQYQVSTIQDPLTGETRRAPPKPQWVLDLEEVGRAVVNITIKPSASASGEPADQKKSTVIVDGKPTPVFTEKESLTNIGRDELLDSRTTKMDLLVRSSSESEPVPNDLQVPIAVAEHFHDESFPKLVSAAQEPIEETESPSSPVEEKKAEMETVSSPTETSAVDNAASGIFRFWNVYPNSLLRFASAPSSRPPSVALSPSNPTLVEESESPSLASEPPKTNETTGNDDAPSVPGAMCLASSSQTGRQMYPLSMLIMAALIGFLLGSLLRSLISPADFIYVSTDLKELEAGWREIKRLVEVKYIVGGWDFQIAVVRRH
ncbi:hypothetical protein BXZ70DRAFT_949630 [Cristinia sonorae]|uniref:START domain-containing protein n=1 Tax=Cristinia sonorae TaxID=1940300 RepID=A0A8K0UKM5_9AGAR|nr:hypothetical protein BXZ70DRAFT_949630 [Cristinia sonorae]